MIVYLIPSFPMECLKSPYMYIEARKRRGDTKHPLLKTDVASNHLFVLEYYTVLEFVNGAPDQINYLFWKSIYFKETPEALTMEIMFIHHYT